MKATFWCFLHWCCLYVSLIYLSLFFLIIFPRSLFLMILLKFFSPTLINFFKPPRVRCFRTEFEAFGTLLFSLKILLFFQQNFYFFQNFSTEFLLSLFAYDLFFFFMQDFGDAPSDKPEIVTGSKVSCFEATTHAINVMNESCGSSKCQAIKT